MELNIPKLVKVNAKTLYTHIYVRDQFSGTLKDAHGEVIINFEDVYVPKFFPGIHHGDVVHLEIDIETGQILNWEKPTTGDIESWIKTVQERDDE